MGDFVKMLTKIVAEVGLPREHYLLRAKDAGHQYFQEFLSAGESLHKVMSEKEFRRWYEERVFLKKGIAKFDEKAFIQGAVETSVVRFFAEKYPKDFKLEEIVGFDNKKNVECQLVTDGCRYNVEVKCPSFCGYNEVQEVEKVLKFSTMGRAPDWKTEKEYQISLGEELKRVAVKSGEPLKGVIQMKTMDNNLKDFLISAHEKFGSVLDENEVNVLVVGCDDVEDIQRWWGYLWANEGVFTSNSFVDKSKYSNVDVVVLTNLYFKHNKYYQKNVCNYWSLDGGFNLIFSNPYRLKHKELAIKKFIEFLPNYSSQIDAYSVQGKSLGEVESFIRVIHFVRDFLEKQKGVYLFKTL